MLKLARDSYSDSEEDEAWFGGGGKAKCTLQSKYVEAKALYDLGKYSESLEISNEIHSRSKSESGNKDPLRVSIANLVALNLRKLGKHEEKLAAYEEILESQEKLHGPEHEDPLNTLYDMATALHRLRRFEEAEEAFESIHELSRKVLGQEHGNTLRALEWIKVGPKGIRKIVKILAEDPTAVQKMEDIFRELGVSAGQYEQSHKYDKFQEALVQFYYNLNGSIGASTKLLNCFDKLGRTRVAEQVRSEVATAQEQRSLWLKRQKPVEFFTGRTAELKQIHSYLTRKDNKTAAVVISQSPSVSTFSGIGKSELARKYAENYRSFYSGGGIWIDASTEKSFHASLKTATQQLNLPVEMSSASILETVYKYSSAKPFLIILDNVVDLEILELLPRGPTRPNVLITSEITEWKEEFEVLHLDVLKEVDAEDFVRKSCPSLLREPNPEPDVKNLVSGLRYLPFALRMAVACIENSRFSKRRVPEYLKSLQAVLESNLLRNPKMASSHEHETIIVAATMVTMRKVKRQEYGAETVAILRLISYFDPEYIQTNLLRVLKGANLCKLFAHQCGTHVGNVYIDDSFKLLGKYKIIKLKGQFGVSVHRLFLHAIRTSIGLDNSRILEDGIVAMMEIMKSPDSCTSNIAFPHAISIWGYAMKFDNAVKKYGRFPSILAEKLQRDEKYSAVLQLVKDSCFTLENVLGDRDENTIGLRYEEGMALYGMGQYADSLEGARKIYTTSKSALTNPYSTLRMDICSLISKNLEAQGESMDLEIHEEMLEIRRKMGTIRKKML